MLVHKARGSTVDVYSSGPGHGWAPARGPLDNLLYSMYTVTGGVLVCLGFSLSMDSDRWPIHDPTAGQANRQWHRPVPHDVDRWESIWSRIIPSTLTRSPSSSQPKSLSFRNFSSSITIPTLPDLDPVWRDPNFSLCWSIPTRNSIWGQSLRTCLPWDRTTHSPHSSSSHLGIQGPRSPSVTCFYLWSPHPSLQVHPSHS